MFLVTPLRRGPKGWRRRKTWIGLADQGAVCLLEATHSPQKLVTLCGTPASGHECKGEKGGGLLCEGVRALELVRVLAES